MRGLVVVLALGAACGGGRSDEARRGSGSPPPSTAATVKLFVGPDLVGTVDGAIVAGWPRLETLLPESARRLGKWTAIATSGAQDRTIERPFEQNRDLVPALYPGPGATIAFGLFDPVEYGRRGTPAVRADAVTSIAITLDTSGARGENDHGGGDAVDPATLELAIVHPGGEAKLTGTQLLAIPREDGPMEWHGWKLTTILGAAGLRAPVTRLRLFDAAGTSLSLEPRDLGTDAIPFVKLNRQGALRFRLFRKEGDGWRSAADLRALVKIELLR